MNFAMRMLSAAAVLLCVAGNCRAEGEVLKDADFGGGAKAWGGVGADEQKEVAVIDLAGGAKGMKLVRKAAGAGVAFDQTVKMKPQTLYELVVKGHGAAKVCMRIRPQNSTDKEFSNLTKCWATSTAPLPAAGVAGEAEKADKTVTSEFVFDSGLKTDQAIVNVYMDGKDPGEYVIESISLKEVGSSKPALSPADEKIILHLGDSITITSYLPFGERVEKAIGDLLAREVAGKKVRQINWAADGEYIKDLLDSGRYQKTVKENFERVDVVVIRYGANDFNKGTVEEFKKQLAALCDRLEKDYPGVKIVLGTGTYLPKQKAINEKYSPFWQAARDLAGERKYGLADVYAAFEKLQSDKLCRGAGDMHPSAEGVKVIGEVVWEAVKGLVK